MKDRIPTRLGRVKLTDESTGVAKYYTMEMADLPSEAGTPINKETLLTDETTSIIFGSTADKTVNLALKELGSNRALTPDDGLYRLSIEEKYPYYTMDVHPGAGSSISTLGSSAIIPLNDYDVVLGKNSQKVYNHATGELVRSTTLTDSIEYNPRNFAFYDGNFCGRTGGDGNNYQYFSVYNVQTGGLYYTSTSNMNSVILAGADSTYLYIVFGKYIDEYNQRYAIRKITKSTMTVSGSDITTTIPYNSTYYAGLCGYGTKYYILDTSTSNTPKLTAIDLTTGASTSNALTGASGFSFTGVGLTPWYDPDLMSVFMGASNSNVPHIVGINISTRALTNLGSLSTIFGGTPATAVTYCGNLYGTNVAILTDYKTVVGGPNILQVAKINLLNGSVSQRATISGVTSVNGGVLTFKTVIPNEARCTVCGGIIINKTSLEAETINTNYATYSYMNGYFYTLQIRGEATAILTSGGFAVTFVVSGEYYYDLLPFEIEEYVHYPLTSVTKVVRS